MLVRRQAIRHFSRSTFFNRPFSSSNRKFSTTFSKEQQTKNEQIPWWKLGAACAAISIGYLWSKDKFYAEEQPPAEEQTTKPESQTIEKKYKYVILGTGIPALIAIDQIREKDKENEILIIGSTEPAQLSKKSLIKIASGNDDAIISVTELPEKIKIKKKVEIIIADFCVFGKGHEIHAEVDLENKKYKIEFEKCIIATGTHPKDTNLNADPSAPLLPLNFANDARKLNDLVESENKKFAVIGGDFWVCDLVGKLSAAYEKAQIYQIVAEDGILANFLPPYLAEFITQKYKASFPESVQILTNSKIASIGSTENQQASIQFENQSESLLVDQAVYFTERIPNLQYFAKDFEVDSRGIFTDRQLRVLENVYAAGEVVSHFSTSFGRRRLEGEDHEILSGLVAARNITSEKTSNYRINDVVEGTVAGIPLKFIGKCDASLPTVAVWLKHPENWGHADFENNYDYRIGVIYYVGADDKVVGVALWNLRDKEFQYESKLVNQMGVAGRTFTKDLHFTRGVAISENVVAAAYDYPLNQ